MKVTIDPCCSGCGLCISTCPEVFELNDDTVSVVVDEVPAEYEEEIQIAADECPLEAIQID
jgi:ferredoxin